MLLLQRRKMSISLRITIYRQTLNKPLLLFPKRIFRLIQQIGTLRFYTNHDKYDLCKITTLSLQNIRSSVNDAIGHASEFYWLTENAGHEIDGPAIIILLLLYS